MNRHDIGGALFVGLLLAFALLVGAQLAARIDAHLQERRTGARASPDPRRLQRVAAFARIAAPVCLALAGVLFVWLSGGAGR